MTYSPFACARRRVRALNWDTAKETKLVHNSFLGFPSWPDFLHGGGGEKSPWPGSAAGVWNKAGGLDEAKRVNRHQLADSDRRLQSRRINRQSAEPKMLQILTETRDSSWQLRTFPASASSGSLEALSCRRRSLFFFFSLVSRLRQLLKCVQLFKSSKEKSQSQWEKKTNKKASDNVQNVFAVPTTSCDCRDLYTASGTENRKTSNTALSQGKAIITIKILILYLTPGSK